MSIAQVIAAVNQMAADGVIDTYAIGGAVGATFYLEPVATLDVDIFITFRPEPGRLLVSTAPHWDYLISRGAVVDGEYLVEDALASAVTFDVDGTPARVFPPEHLAAIALETGRAKDKARLLQFIEADAFDREAFESLVEKFGIADKWSDFKEAFL